MKNLLKNFFITNQNFIFKSLFSFFLIILLLLVLNIIFTFSIYPTLNKTLDKIGNDIQNDFHKKLPQSYFDTNEKIEKKKIILRLALDEIKPFKDEISDFFCE